MAGNAMAAVCGAGLNVVTVTPTPLAYNNYDPKNGTTSSSTITMGCLFGGTLPSFTIALSAGGANSFSPRQMSFLTAKLNYNLYTTMAMTTVWGDGTGGTSTQTYNTSANLTAPLFTIYGQIPMNQLPSPGLYGDTINVTVTY